MHKRESLERTPLILMCKGFSYVSLEMAITFTMYLLADGYPDPVNLPETPFQPLRRWLALQPCS
jgi:hypothetical protein